MNRRTLPKKKVKRQDDAYLSHGDLGPRGLDVHVIIHDVQVVVDGAAQSLP